MVDLVTHEIVDMIPSRNEADVAQWLATYPNIKLVSRDGAMFFRGAITRAHPEAIQVSDRFHYLKTIADHFREAIMQALPTHIAATAEEPNALLDSNQSPRHQEQPSSAWLRKQKLVVAVRAARSEGQSLAEIGRRYALDSRTVTRYVTNEFQWRPRRPHNRLLDFIPEIQALVRKGYKSRAIYNRLVELGYDRAFRTFQSYLSQATATRSKPAQIAHITRRQVAGLIFKRYGACDWTPLLQSVLNQYPLVKTILSLFFDFVILCENYDLEALDQWLRTAGTLNNPAVNKACTAIRRDYDAIGNSIIFREFSNGPMEGKNTKTKFIKRGMFGRMSFDVLKTKMLLLEEMR